LGISRSSRKVNSLLRKIESGTIYKNMTSNLQHICNNANIPASSRCPLTTYFLAEYTVHHQSGAGKNVIRGRRRFEKAQGHRSLRRRKDTCSGQT